MNFQSNYKGGVYIINYLITITGRVYNDEYVFYRDDGNIHDEINEIIKEMRKGNIKSLRVTAQKREG